MRGAIGRGTGCQVDRVERREKKRLLLLRALVLRQGSDEGLTLETSVIVLSHSVPYCSLRIQPSPVDLKPPLATARREMAVSAGYPYRPDQLLVDNPVSCHIRPRSAPSSFWCWLHNKRHREVKYSFKHERTERNWK